MISSEDGKPHVQLRLAYQSHQFVVRIDIRVCPGEVDERTRGVDGQNLRPDRDAGRFCVPSTGVPDVVAEAEESLGSDESANQQDASLTVLSIPRER
jgi:hypothetical protein